MTVAALLLAVATVATLIPALKALRSSPVEALRSDL
jgi:ABC-type lipoprotein release transport system permease subunit